MPQINYRAPEVIEETNRLVKAAQEGDTRAEGKLIVMYEDYILFMISKYVNKTAIKGDVDELRSCIHRGLIVGIRRYSPKFNALFIYYAHNWMKKMIMQDSQQCYRMIRLPVNQDNFRTTFKNRWENASDLDLAGYYIDEEYPTYVNILKSSTKLFTDVVSETYTDKSTPSFSDTYNQDKLKFNIEKVLRKFTPLEKDIIESLFGLNGKEEVSADSLGEKYNITRVDVTKIKSNVIRLMRHKVLSGILLDNINDYN
ncbi:MAG: hypothetical protein KAH32_01810 [Chlamydiia bacterium]|nr:hypothetical protein [Chlamydiia bacterium]